MIFEKIRKIIVSELNVEESAISSGTTFAALNVDANDIGMLIEAIDAQFGVELEEGNFDGATTVGELAAFIESCI